MAVAATVGATLPELPELDGARHYLPSLDGRHRRKQFYRASVEADRDGTVWPCVTFCSLRTNTRTAWKPRDLAWQQFIAERAGATVPAGAREAYRAAAAAAIEDARTKAAERERQQAAGREAAAEAAAAAWAAAEPCAGHPYLDRKRVASHGLRVARQDARARLWNDEASEWQHTLAVRAGDLLVPMHDDAGRLVNLQRVGEDGKRFIMGGRAHGCHFRIAGTSGRTVLAEGYATGATWHEATGDDVVLAFSAGALSVVAGYARPDAVAADNDESGTGQSAAAGTGLRVYLPPTLGDWNDYAAARGLDGVRTAIANADAPVISNPWKLPAVELKGRESGWWRLLAESATPADAAAAAWAIGRRLVMRVPILMLSRIVRQIEATAPAGTMNPATLEAIRAALGRIVDWRQRRALAGFSMSAEAMAHHNVETVEALPVLQPEDYRGVVLLAAPMGSGKTLHVGRPFAAWASTQPERFIGTCHRQSLAAELSRVLGCAHYRDELAGAEFAWRVQALATCLPSIVKDAHAQIVAEAGYVFIDEIAQVLRSIAAGVTVADRKTPADVFAALRDLVARARCVIGADAGMDDRTLAFLESCRPGERFRIIQQAHKREGLAVRFGYGPEALTTAYAEALARLGQGERLWIACGERRRAEEAHRVLSAAGVRVLLLHGHNHADEGPAAFWRDPEGESLRYDCVIASPVVSSGLSITHRDAGQHFTHGMLLTSGARITPADALQMLRRVRYLRSWTVAVTPNNAHDIESADALLEGMASAAGLEGLAVADVSDFDRFVAGVEADEARQRADFAAGLWWALEHQGFAVMPLDLIEDEDVELAAKAARADLKAERRAAILSAPDLAELEARRLRRKIERTEAEEYALLRHRIKADMGVDVLDDEALDAWDDGRGPRRLDRFSAATQGLAEREGVAGADLALRRFGKARALAYAWLFRGVKIGPGLRLTDDVARVIVSRVIERRSLLAFLGIVPAKWARDMGDKPMPMPAYPVREVGDLLERMGLETKRRRNNKKAPVGARCGSNHIGENRPSGTQRRQIIDTETIYEVTTESWERTAMWAESRNRRRQASGVESDADAWRSLRRSLLDSLNRGELTRAEGRHRILALLNGRGPCGHAWLTAQWWRDVVAVRCAA